MESIWVIGLMSGTFLDGIDAALLKTDGRMIQEIGPGLAISYDPLFRERLYHLLQNTESPERVQLEQEITDRHTYVVQQLIQQSGITPELIGFHGQTVYHKPRTLVAKTRTLQIGDGQRMANELGIPVVYDFRRNDVDNGGEGAPLAPVFHQALADHCSKPLAIINIGGVSNITLITDERLYAGDVGPGGALIDDWVKKHTRQSYDKDGQTAAKGEVHHGLINQWMNHPFFQQLLPKSLDRQTFYQCLEDCQNLSPDDGAATLTAFTTEGIKHGIRSHTTVQSIILSGGGRHNLHLRELLAQSFIVRTTEDLGWYGDLIEAQAFAYLAVRSIYNLPLSFPTTTGVPKPLTGGKFAKPIRISIPRTCP
jgi:anhydro-N-acetylmuramic acid kinase